MSNHWFITARRKALERRLRALGKMNFVPGKAVVKVSPLEEMPVERSSVPNFEPLLPRPWRRMRVCVWGEVGRTMKGSGWFAVDALDLDIADCGDYLTDRGEKDISNWSWNNKRLVLLGMGRYKAEMLFGINLPATNNQPTIPGSSMKHKLAVGSRENASSRHKCRPTIIHEVVVYLIIYHRYS